MSHEPAGRLGRRLAESTPSYFEYPKPPEGSPNIVMIVLDDVGFAQLSCFGGAISTPNIDRLAAGGLRYNRFHVTSICSSTRASLLTGRNHHAVGIGLTQESTLGFPGYTGRIPKSAASLARVLRDTGYSTMAVGKWHLAGSGEYSAAGPMDRWPLGMGFEKYYGFLAASTNQWAPNLVRDNTLVEPPRTPAEGYHLTEDLADETIRMILDQQQAAPGKPFFTYLAPGAAHSPHHVTPEWVEPYRGVFDGGWERYRSESFARQVAQGIIPDNTELTTPPSWIPDWDSLSTDERRVYARYMEVFAGFMTHTDAQIGRVIDFLSSQGLLDNTVVMVLSDNGASGEGTVTGNFHESKAIRNRKQDIGEAILRIDEIGGQTMMNHYPWPWAWAGNTPFRLWKRYTWLGGTRTPLIIHWPNGISDAGSIRSQFCHAIDVFPTLLDAIGIESPEAVDGVKQQRIDGVSLLDTFTNGEEPEVHPVQYFEMHGSSSMYADGWKATTDYISPIFGERDFLEGSDDFDKDHWALFDLDSDFAEAQDVSADNPDKVRALEQLWWAEAGRNQVLPLFEGMSQVVAKQPLPWAPPATGRYLPGGGRVTADQLPDLTGGFTIIGDIEVGDRANGIVTAFGDRNGGFAIYLLDGRPVVHFVLLDSIARVEGIPIKAGRHLLEWRCSARPGAHWGSGSSEIELVVDGESAGSASLSEIYAKHSVPTGAGFHVGRDVGLPVASDYSPPFAFEGVIHDVTVHSARGVAAENVGEDFDMAQRQD